MKRFNEWLGALSLGKKTLLGFGAVFASLFIIGASQPPKVNLDSASTANLSQSQTNKPKAPAVTTKTETETQSIPFTSTTVNDATLAKGTTKITTTGVNGSQTLTYTVTYTNGQQTDKKLTNTTVTTQPVTQVTSVGTYVAPPPPPPKCDPNYSGACVPNVYPSDVDCAGGSGNGPYYVQGPVTVIGTDIYHLDSNGNGVGCE